MSEEKIRDAHQEKTVPLSNEEAAQLAFEVFPEDILRIATNILRCAFQRDKNPRFAVANHNALLLVHYLTGRLAELPVVTVEASD